MLAWRRGRWDEAYNLATLDLDVERIPPVSYAWLCAAAAQIAASMGRADETEHLVEVALRSSTELNLPLVSAWAHAARGHLALSRGEPAKALPSFDLVLRDVTKMGLRETGFFLWHGDYLEALIGAGNIVEARAALDELRITADETGRQWAHGITARATALLAVDAQVAQAAFARAHTIFLELGMPFEIARTLLASGRANRLSAPQQARDDLRQAEAAFIKLGAELWAEQTTKLRRKLGEVDTRPTGGETRLLRELSPTEAGVALCAASGSTNREIAAELHVSVRTVEFHLRSIYRKTGVKNRAELVARFLSE